MASLEQHCQDCVEQLGEEYREVHIWLDEFFAQMPGDFRHRKYRHHTAGVLEALAKWGEKGAKAAEIHIRRDFPNLGRIPTREDWIHPDSLLKHCDFMQNIFPH